MTPEGKVKAQIKAGLDGIEAYYFMPVQTGYGKRALDFIVCYKGRFISIEAKAGNNKPTREQEDIGRQITNADGIYVVAYGWPDVVARLQSFGIFLPKT